MKTFEKELTTLINRHSIEIMPASRLAEMICHIIEAMRPSIKKTLNASEPAVSSARMLKGVCCQYCAHFEQDECPVKIASPWSRWGNWCNVYEPIPDKPLPRACEKTWRDECTCIVNALADLAKLKEIIHEP
jgi:hypothetical protein